MNAFRNLFVLACIGAIMFAFLYAARPEWFAGVIASGKSDPGEFVIRKAVVVIPAQGRSSPKAPEGADIRQLIDFEDDGLPSRVNPYVLVINSGDRTMRYYRLSNHVKSVNVRTTNPDVVAKKPIVVDSNGPIQLEVWIPNSREVKLEIEYQTPKR